MLGHPSCLNRGAAQLWGSHLRCTPPKLRVCLVIKRATTWHGVRWLNGGQPSPLTGSSLQVVYSLCILQGWVA
jgi:hypothetical protein